ncbi:uncharacterized protein LOC126614308 isoform X2 [Malus sylvestris]|uniref:uncharacterized protein LOC126614308 isoform X2 n=1 Tax=Malus sylvestris TaxID=3752 RepID=UPI0021ACB08F|nr:uncharacterized protein LOC126614308 isoform X2 [Malus sylvestris]
MSRVPFLPTKLNFVSSRKFNSKLPKDMYMKATHDANPIIRPSSLFLSNLLFLAVSHCPPVPAIRLLGCFLHGFRLKVHWFFSRQRRLGGRDATILVEEASSHF